jgi:hypothetical protein
LGGGKNAGLVSLHISCAFCRALRPACERTDQPPQQAHEPPKAKGFVREVERLKVNENVLMLLGAQLGGAYLQMAQDVAVVVNDGDNMRVLRWRATAQ